MSRFVSNIFGRNALRMTEIVFVILREPSFIVIRREHTLFFCHPEGAAALADATEGS